MKYRVSYFDGYEHLRSKQLPAGKEWNSIDELIKEMIDLMVPWVAVCVTCEDEEENLSFISLDELIYYSK